MSAPTPPVVPPQCVILAGPNGAGKSTAAPFLLPEALRIRRFLNADTIARGLSGFDPDEAAVLAGRTLLDAMDQYAAAGLDFATETTLSGRSLAQRLRKLKRDHGYAVRLHYLWVPDAEYSVNRVALRVSRGGHAIPPEVCRRRYGMSLDNLFRRYAPVADRWTVYDSSAKPLAPIAEGEGGAVTRVDRQELWDELTERHGPLGQR